MKMWGKGTVFIHRSIPINKFIRHDDSAKVSIKY
jgi:hypothetical protein